MKAGIGRLLARFDRRQIEREVDEQLRFHLELLAEEHLQQDMSWDEAKAAALKRFGNFEQIKDQCVGISRQSRPFILALKVLLPGVFLLGVLVRVLGTESSVTRIGDILMVVGVLSRWLLHLRGLNPSTVVRDREIPSPLLLHENSRVSFTAYDQRHRTPIERVISDK